MDGLAKKIGHRRGAHGHTQMNGEEKRVMAVQNAARSEAPAERDIRSVTSTDQGIVDAISRRDHRQALSLCARQYGSPLGRLCMALVGSQAEADDLVQETLLDAHAAFAGYRAEGSLRAWLFAIARRKCARHLERRTQHGNKLRLVHDSERSPAVLDVLVEREQAVAARAALAEIRPSEREALVLRFLGELSFHEVGQACGIDEAAARKRVSRGLAHLREIVGRTSS
jgi:RNA polymerase sigma-70 factor, ECF subfamily